MKKEKFKTYNDVFDRFTINNLNKIFNTLGLKEPKIVPVSIGKEANVFKLEEDNKRFALKIYRLETCDFHRMQTYLKNDTRITIKTKKQREIIFLWAKREFINLEKARELSLRTPLPFIQRNNILLMSFIGDDWPAPKLKDYAFHSKEELKNVFIEIIKAIKKLKENNLVHGDLSEYNVLVKDNQTYIIDLSHMTPLKTTLGPELLIRDIKNIRNFFIKKGLEKEYINKKIKKLL